MIVVDTGSRDRTPATHASSGARQCFAGAMTSARNHSFSRHIGVDSSGLDDILLQTRAGRRESAPRARRLLPLRLRADESGASLCLWRADVASPAVRWLHPVPSAPHTASHNLRRGEVVITLGRTAVASQRLPTYASAARWQRSSEQDPQLRYYGARAAALATIAGLRHEAFRMPGGWEEDRVCAAAAGRVPSASRPATLPCRCASPAARGRSPRAMRSLGRAYVILITAFAEGTGRSRCSGRRASGRCRRLSRSTRTCGAEAEVGLRDRLATSGSQRTRGRRARP